MGTKSSDGYKVLIAILSKLCKVFFGFFSKSNQNCFYFPFLTGTFCAAYIPLLIFTFYKLFPIWSFYFKKLLACSKDFLNMKHFPGVSSQNLTSQLLLRFLPLKKRCTHNRPWICYCIHFSQVRFQIDSVTWLSDKTFFEKTVC